MQLGVQVWLARLLAPEDFGLMAMLLVVTAIGQVFVEGGMGVALIHAKDSSREDESTVLYCNAALAGLVVLVLWFAAPAVAAFYQRAELVGMLRLSSTGLAAGALGVVQSSILRRQLAFRSLSIINLGTVALAGGISIFMASQGFGVWSLVWQFVLSSMFRSAGFWLFSDWRPLLAFHMESIRRIGAYGTRLVASNLISTVFQNLNQVLIGKFYQPVDLGYYNRAQVMQGLPVNTFSEAVSGVMLPAFVQINENPAKFQMGFQEALRCSAAISVPMMALLGVLAEPVFMVVLGAKWLPAVPYFQLFCLSGMLYPIQLLNVNTLLAQGQPQLYLRAEVGKRVLALLGSVAALPFGVMAFAVASVIVSFLSLVVNTHYSAIMMDFGLGKQMRLVAPLAGGAVIAGASSWLALSFCPGSPILRIAICGIVFGALYLALTWRIAVALWRFARGALENRVGGGTQP